MSKIGICACYDTHNYGSMLQSFATQYMIDSLGYDSEFIIYKKKKDVLFYIKAIPRLFNATMFNDKKQKALKILNRHLHRELNMCEQKRDAAFRRFQETYYRRFSSPYYGYESLVKAARGYDTIVVGSDQLWLPAGLATNFYNLMFVPDDVNKVSYATSFGVGSIPFYQEKRTAEYLKRIDYLSVREIQGAKIIKQLTGRDARVVADPTLLLSREEWDEVIPYKQIVNGNYIFCYFLGTNPAHRQIAEELKEETGMKIVTTPFMDSYVKTDEAFGDEKLYDIGPDDFVNLIRNAAYILTDSFHGSVFSIINNKCFVVFDRFQGNGTNSRNSRIDSLCQKLELRDRRYQGSIVEAIRGEIDYDRVNDRLVRLREESIAFLKGALAKEEQYL